MTHSFNTAKFTSPIKGRKGIQSYWCEVIDFDNESSEFEVEAYDYADANSRAASIANAMGIQINFINIYKY